MQMLAGDVVLITGAGSGLGLGVARHCIGEGAQLVIMEVSHEKVAKLKQEFGNSVLVIQGDVTRIDELQRCRSEVEKRFGRLNALIGCHGIFDGNVHLADIPLERIESLFDELFHVNVLGYILCVKVFMNMLAETKGAIVLTASTAAFAGDGGGIAYTGSKGAVRSMVGQLAFEFSKQIRVNAVAPGAIANSELRGPKSLGLENQKQSDIPKEAFLAGFRALSLMNDVPTPDEHGPIYAFLASRHNTLVTGQTYVLDQGLLNRAAISGTGTEPGH